MVSANTSRDYVNTYLSPQLGNFLFQNADPFFVPITLEFDLFSVLHRGTIVKSFLGSSVRLQDVYKLPFLPTNLILCRSLAGITTERWLYSPLFSLRFCRGSGRRWTIFLCGQGSKTIRIWVTEIMYLN